MLATYYYAPDYNTEWGGLLLQVGRYSQVGFEQSYYSWELTGGCSYLGRSGELVLRLPQPHRCELPSRPLRRLP